jgi:hypothetical protein
MRDARRIGECYPGLSPNVVARVNSGQGLLTQPRAGAQPEQREPVFTPIIAKSPGQVFDYAAEL